MNGDDSALWHEIIGLDVAPERRSELLAAFESIGAEIRKQRPAVVMNLLSKEYVPIVAKNREQFPSRLEAREP